MPHNITNIKSGLRKLTNVRFIQKEDGYLIVLNFPNTEVRSRTSRSGTKYWYANNHIGEACAFIAETIKVDRINPNGSDKLYGLDPDNDKIYCYQFSTPDKAKAEKIVAFVEKFIQGKVHSSTEQYDKEVRNAKKLEKLAADLLTPADYSEEQLAAIQPPPLLPSKTKSSLPDKPKKHSATSINNIRIQAQIDGGTDTSVVVTLQFNHAHNKEVISLATKLKGLAHTHNVIIKHNPRESSISFKIPQENYDQTFKSELIRICNAEHIDEKQPQQLSSTSHSSPSMSMSLSRSMQQQQSSSIAPGSIAATLVQTSSTSLLSQPWQALTPATPRATQAMPAAASAQQPPNAYYHSRLPIPQPQAVFPPSPFLYALLQQQHTLALHAAAQGMSVPAYYPQHHVTQPMAYPLPQAPQHLL